MTREKGRPGVLHDSLKIGSVEGLLGAAEIDHLAARISAELGDGARYSVTGRTRSVHSVEGQGLERVKEVYEPRGPRRVRRTPRGHHRVARCRRRPPHARPAQDLPQRPAFHGLALRRVRPRPVRHAARRLPA
ncbi:hypothetical protein [Streptomyces thioluteus]|uniref:hypothetical protein n=1 Tax=Streptomyces thioluteus TaxID=66431 RepID=UPI0031F0A2BE